MKYFILWLVLATLASCQNGIDKKTVIGVQPYGSFPKSKTEFIAKTIDSFYGVKTIMLPEKKLYVAAFVTIKSPRYRADSIIHIQKRA